MKAKITLFRIVGIVLLLMGLLLAVAQPGAGFVAAAVGVLVLVLGPKSLQKSNGSENNQTEGAESTSLLEQMNAYAEAHPTEKQRIAKRKAEARAQGIACCPKCGSTSLSANKKGFGAGKAVAGMVVTGGVGGAVFGAVGSGKVVVTCLNCGYKFKPGKK